MLIIMRATSSTGALAPFQDLTATLTVVKSGGPLWLILSDLTAAHFTSDQADVTNYSPMMIGEQSEHERQTRYTAERDLRRVMSSECQSILGTNCEPGEMLLCLAQATAAGTFTSWLVNVAGEDCRYAHLEDTTGCPGSP